MVVADALALGAASKASHDVGARSRTLVAGRDWDTTAHVQSLCTAPAAPSAVLD